MEIENESCWNKFDSCCFCHNYVFRDSGCCLWRSWNNCIPRTSLYTTARLSRASLWVLVGTKLRRGNKGFSSKVEHLHYMQETVVRFHQSQPTGISPSGRGDQIYLESGGSNPSSPTIYLAILKN